MTPSRITLSVFCVATCVVIAALSALGWVTGDDTLTSVQPGLPAMVPMTAALMVAAGAAILRQTRGRTARSGALLLVAIAALLLLCHSLIHAHRHLPGLAWIDLNKLTSPVTASMFLMTGASLLCGGLLRRVQAGQWLALAVLMLALLTLASYAFRDTALYALLPARGTSVLTTFSFMLLAIALLGLRPHEGMMAAVGGSDAGARIVRRLLLSALALPVLLGLACGIALDLERIDVTTAIACLAWGMIALFTAVVWQAAVLLYREEEARREAERARESALAALRQADANKDDFLALIAHELRNPLAPIGAAADLLRMQGDADPARVRRAGEIIGRQVANMTHLIEDLLDLSRVSRGLLALDAEPVDLHAAVCDAVEQARPQVERRRHRLETELGALHPMVSGDHKRLVQVVANLLGNAAKYTPEGGRIHLALRVHAERGEAQVRVEDNGIGIDPALLPHVFDSFMQGSRSAGRAEGGLGLGLALVKRLAELHGGSVAAFSAGPGQGSCFVLTLPCGTA
ncbi:sensor histidine kinase KdpD [Massilia sp. 9096]|uniref:sensor histidine kinase n=1 Tax=Massilia sp. 9096 TaxID=1500894 RepID=UPI00068F5622|nr:HAMP domain-containing sensor histidine kinase [Massilia sp. 9096]